MRKNEESIFKQLLSIYLYTWFNVVLDVSDYIKKFSRNPKRNYLDL